MMRVGVISARGAREAASRGIVLLLLLLFVGGALLLADPCLAGTTERVSVASDGTQGDGASGSAVLSADGRYVLFDSQSTNLVSGDTNGAADVFIRDQETGEVARVSVATDGTQGNYWSSVGGVSNDGRYVVFCSPATTLVAGDTNDATDVFVRDLEAGETARVSVASDGTQGDAGSWEPVISSDGRYVAFESGATNLVAGDTNGKDDVFLHDRDTGDTFRMSVASDGTQGNWDSWGAAISASGRFVAFHSQASVLVAGDTNGKTDVFVRDRQTSSTERVSVSSGGAQGDENSSSARLSDDGRYVVFQSAASTLVPADTNAQSDVFVRDRQLDTTTRVSVASDGTPANYESRYAAISGDGRYVVFRSQANNLVSDGGGLQREPHEWDGPPHRQLLGSLDRRTNIVGMGLRRWSDVDRAESHP